MTENAGRRSLQFLLSFLTFGVLAVVLYYGFLGLSLPDAAGARLDAHTWKVIRLAEDCLDPDRCLFAGDTIEAIDGVPRATFHANRRSVIYTAGKHVVVTVSREGQRRDLVLPSQARRGDLIAKSISHLLFPLLFWILGAVAISLVKPHDEKWLILVLLAFDAALLFSSGQLSFTHQALSVFVARGSAVLFLPLIIHLHLILPSPIFRGFKKLILPFLYGLAVLTLIADLWQQLPPFLVYGLSLIGMAGALGFLALRFFVPGAPPALRAYRVMVLGVFLGVGPLLFLTLLLAVLKIEPEKLGLGASLPFWALVLMLPNWPLAYLYAILKPGFGPFELRANRVLGSYGFWSLFGVVFLATIGMAATSWPEIFGVKSLAFLFLIVPFSVAVPLLRPVFQRWLDQRVFGIKHVPTEVVSAFAARIPTATERADLLRLIEKEILPTLLIRRSALYLFAGDELERLYEQGLTEAERPFDRAGLDSLDWVLERVELAGADTELGVWLLGRRDPDDDYPPADRSMLRQLGNQIAAVLRLQRDVEEKKSLLDQLVQSQKMEAVGRLSAGIAHDFNNYLSAIMAYSDLLQESTSSSEQKRHLEGIAEASEKAAALTSQLLAFSRPKNTEQRTIGLNALIRGLENLLCRVVGEKAEVELVLAPGELYVVFDPGDLEQVLLNLVVNASDAMPRGGRIVLRTERSETKEWAVLQVEDQGEGIPSEVLGQIFEPFFTTKALGQGTGLGLAMVYALMERAGAKIAVESKVGRGTVFTLRLPSAAGDLLTVEKGADAPSRPRGSETLLLVEDEPSVRRSTAELLRNYGFQVLEAANGFSALELCDQLEGPLDLLLTDVLMPGLGGPELAERLIVRRPSLRVLFMSGLNEVGALGRKGLGKSGIVRKPIQADALLKAVRAQLDSRSPDLETG